MAAFKPIPPVGRTGGIFAFLYQDFLKKRQFHEAKKQNQPILPAKKGKLDASFYLNIVNKDRCFLTVLQSWPNPVKRGFKSMNNPWKEIPLSDYENHMQLDSVGQLQALNRMMKNQFDAYPVFEVMILGVAGGNGLEHISKEKFNRVYGVDINPAYLKKARHRYPDLDGILDCLCIDLTCEADRLPKAELVIANLLIEYIGYERFQQVIAHVHPKYVSCMIQVDIEKDWVSDSPYLHVFDGLETIHHQIESQALEQAMQEIDSHPIQVFESLLPNQKKLIQIDFKK